MSVRRQKIEAGITPFVKQIDTVAAEFPAFTNYLYMTYNAIVMISSLMIMVLWFLDPVFIELVVRSSLIGVLFEQLVHLREQGKKTIMVNYNPETVSTDYDEADRLYFEVINNERVLDIYELEQSSGVVISMGGQTSNNIAFTLHRHNVKILGTSPEMIDSAENRYKFSVECLIELELINQHGRN